MYGMWKTLCQVDSAAAAEFEKVFQLYRASGKSVVKRSSVHAVMLGSA